MYLFSFLYNSIGLLIIKFYPKYSILANIETNIPPQATDVGKDLSGNTVG